MIAVTVEWLSNGVLFLLSLTRVIPYGYHTNAVLIWLIIIIIVLLLHCRRQTMDMEILVTILLCVVAAVFTLVSLFFFAKKRQKSYEEVFTVQCKTAHPCHVNRLNKMRSMLT